MSTHDVPGAKAKNGDTLAMGCWAEHEDGSLIFVEAVEAGKVIYSIFDVAADPVQELRDAMPEAGFKAQYSWPNKNDLKWTWHDKTLFPWDRVMGTFPAGARHASAKGAMTAAQRMAEVLDKRAEPLRERMVTRPGGAAGIMQRIHNAVEALRG